MGTGWSERCGSARLRWLPERGRGHRAGRGPARRTSPLREDGRHLEDRLVAQLGARRIAVCTDSDEGIDQDRGIDHRHGRDRLMRRPLVGQYLGRRDEGETLAPSVRIHSSLWRTRSEGARSAALRIISASRCSWRLMPAAAARARYTRCTPSGTFLTWTVASACVLALLTLNCVLLATARPSSGEQNGRAVGRLGPALRSGPAADAARARGPSAWPLAERAQLIGAHRLGPERSRTTSTALTMAMATKIGSASAMWIHGSTMRPARGPRPPSP